MLDLITSFFSFFRKPSLLLPAPATVKIQPLSDDDIPALWDLLVPGKKGHLSVEYAPLAYRAACKRLDNAVYQIQQRGGTVRGVFLCEDGDSQAYNFPALPIGLLKLYSELPKTARTTKYAPVQRFHKDDKGWLWLALLLAEPNPNKAPVVTPLAAAVPESKALLARLMDVPAQPIYPAPVQVQTAELPPLRQDSDVVTRPLPVADDAETQTHRDTETDEDEPLVADAETQTHRDTETDEDEPLVADVREVAAAVIDRKRAEVTPTPDEDTMSAWLDLDEPKAPRIKLSELIKADNIAFIGPKGSGKTTGLLTAVKHRQGETVALDPHATPNKWPCRTLGNGRNYEVIRRALKAFAREMQKRFDAIGDGSKPEKYYLKPNLRRTMVNDEFRSIAKSVLPVKAVRDKGVEVQAAEPGAGDYLLERISEGRKVGECVMIACHNDTLEALGLPVGAADMKTCFDYFVYCGGLAMERYERRGKARPEALNELRSMSHPAVVWHTERNQWFILDFDLEPVLPPDDEEKDDDGEPLEIDTAVPALPRVPTVPSPAATLRLLAQRAAIALPVTGSVKERLALLDDPRIVMMLHVVGRRGMNAQDAAQVLFEPVNGDLRTAVKKILDTAPKA